MEIFRTFQTVAGPQLVVDLPERFQGRTLEVTIVPVEDVEGKPIPPEEDPRYARYIQKRPELTEEQKKLLAENPYPLRGTVLRYDDPFEPAVPPEDWEANE